MRRSRVVKTDEEVALEMKAAGKSQIQINTELKRRRETAEKVQAGYDTAPPARPYQRTDA